MNKKTLKTIATGAAITLATVGASTVSADTQYGIQLNRVTGEWQTVNHATGEIVKSEPNETYSSYEEAQASLVTSTVETPVTTETPAAETTAVEAPKTSADVKPALDAQQAIVDATSQDAANAQADADAANQAVATAEADVATANEAVSDAEANAANTTPANIAANQADQKANLADQEANATETDEVNAEITAQTQTVADAQTAVDTAQANKDAADADVAAKDASVKAAQAAIDGTGVEQAQANLTQAQADVKTATTDVDTATKAVDTAKKADADRDAKVKAAETDVKTKSDAVTTASNRVTAAQGKVSTTTDTLTKANDAITKAQDALKNIDTVTIADLSQFKADKAEGDSDFMTDSGATVIEQSSTKIGEDDKTKIVDFTNITAEQAQELALYNLQVINAIRQQFGLPAFELNTGSMKAAKDQMDKYVARNQNILTAGHLPGDYFGENGGPIALAKFGTSMTMYDVKQNIYHIVMTQAFADAPSNWGHSNNIQKQVSDFGASFGIIAGELYSINVFGVYSGTPIANPNDSATLQATLTKAQAEQSQAQTASDQSKAELTKASSDYAATLDAKTKAEKVLADAMATPLQTQVAENNLRLAEIALQNAEARKADAQKAVDNFSADLAEKKATLDTAKAELATAQATATAKAEVFDAAKAELTKQEATLTSLNAEKDALLAEKDRLVEEAKALATELKGYLEAGTKLEEAKAELSDKETTLKDALAKADATNTALETINAKLAEEKAKLAELQTEYDKLKDLEDKAKDNVIATLPDGTIVAVPKDAPIATEKPVINIDAVKQALDKGQDVKVVDGKVVVTNPQAGITVTQTATGEKVTYSRVERAKTLPNTGEQTSLLALAGVAVLSSLGLVVTKRKRRG